MKRAATRSTASLMVGAALALGVLTGCAVTPPTPPVTPKARPAALAKPPAPQRVYAPSADSQALSSYYNRVQSDLITQGLLRQDGGGMDTPFTDTDLVRNFERIAFYDEYVRGSGLSRSGGPAGNLRRWDGAVRIAVEFGSSVDADQRAKDLAAVNSYAARLARVSGHSIRATSAASANFNVLIMGEDDRGEALRRVQQIVPNINRDSLDLFRALPRSIHCLVLAFSGTENDSAYKKAIALVRAEHPDLLRLSCLHEELAQGLGLANDSPRARPSIFNDDDEFALLTTHDEYLLKMLYDRRLRPGMSVEEARPILRVIAAELTAGSS